MMPIHRSWKQDSLTSATRDPDREPSELALRGRTHNTIHTCAGGGTWTCDMARHKPGVSSGADPGRTGETRIDVRYEQNYRYRETWGCRLVGPYARYAYWDQSRARATQR